jgi:hypothetical protein
VREAEVPSEFLDLFISLGHIEIAALHQFDVACERPRRLDP